MLNNNQRNQHNEPMRKRRKYTWPVFNTRWSRNWFWFRNGLVEFLPLVNSTSQRKKLNKTYSVLGRTNTVSHYFGHSMNNCSKTTICHQNTKNIFTHLFKIHTADMLAYYRVINAHACFKFTLIIPALIINWLSIIERLTARQSLSSILISFFKKRNYDTFEINIDLYNRDAFFTRVWTGVLSQNDWWTKLYFSRNINFSQLQ